MFIFRKSYLIFLYDLIATSCSFVIACLFKFNFENLIYIDHIISFSTSISLIFAVIMLNYFSIHKVVLRYFSLHDAIKVFKFSCCFIATLWMALFIVNRLENIPRIILILHLIILNIFLITPRLLWRIMRDYQIKSGLIKDPSNRIQILLIGVNPNTEIFIRNLLLSKNSEYQAVGIIDDKISRYGHLIHNVPIIGNIEMLETLLPKLKYKNILPQKLIITDHNISVEKINYYFEIAEKLGLTIGKIPKITNFESEVSNSLEIKSIIIEDLLGRPQAIAATNDITALVNDKIVLVTGGGGTIGSELVRQLINYKPNKIIIVESSEFNLYQISHELTSYGDLIEFKIGDVRNSIFINHLISSNKIQLIFHAAALKHVPIAEENPVEAVSINFLGTKNICDLAIQNQVEAVIFISTDKAVNPTNIMGASKRLAEHYINYCSNKNPTTKFIMVRFGNVLGSSGSVIPLFERQIMQGGPITLTHPDIKRFFMTVREAVTLVLNSITIGCTASSEYQNGIFILNMGKSIKIFDLAIRMIKLAGLIPEQDIKILITGLRPGEKLFEELSYAHEMLHPTKYNDLMFSNFNIDNIITEEFCEQIIQSTINFDQNSLIKIINNQLSEYK